RWTANDVQVLALVAAQVGPALASATAAKERLQQAQMLRGLNEVAVAAAGVLQPVELAMIAAARARDLLHATGGSITWFDEERNGLRILADSEAAFDPNRVIPVEQAGAQGVAFTTGEPVVIPDYPTWEGRI